MVSVLALVGLVVVVGLNTAIAAVATRFLRIRLNTGWGTAIYVVLVVPFLLLVSTIVLTGILGLGAGLGDRTASIVVAFVIPAVVGISLDVFWMPHPDDVELPDTTEESDAPDRGSTE